MFAQAKSLSRYVTVTALLTVIPIALAQTESEPAELDALAAPAGASVSEPTDVDAADGDAIELQSAGMEDPVDAPSERVETHDLFRSQSILREYDSAVTTGLRLVEIVEAEEGPNSIALADVLTEVGEIQRLAKQHDEAERTLLRSIEIYQSQSGQTAPELVRPMTSLGVNYIDDENYRPAVGVLGEARSLSRRNFGLLNEDQVEIIDHLTVGLIGLRQFEEADQQQLKMLHIYQRNHGVDTIDSLPGVYKHAAYLRIRGRFAEALSLYQRSVRIIQDERGKFDPALAEPLREIGNTYREQLIFDGLGASALKRSIEILEQAEPRDNLGLARSYRDLGDWLTVFSRVGNGIENYETAWQLLNEVEGGDELQRRWFGARTAKWIYRPPFSQRGLGQKGQEPGLKDGFVLIQLDVQPNGRTDNVVILESEPTGAKDETIVRSARRSRLRPYIVDGKAARLEGLRLRYEFHYRPEAF